MVEWSYLGTCTKPADLPAGVLDEWEQTLLAEMTRIKASLDVKVPAEKFEERIADASSDRYEEFLDTVGDPWDAEQIELKQRVKLSASKQAWLDGIAAAFQVGGAFPVNVTAKKNKYKLARFVMGAVGHRATPTGDYGTWNPVTMGVLLLRGDTRPRRYFDANDTMTPSDWSTFESVLDPSLGALISPSIIAKSVYAVMMTKYAVDAGWAEGKIDSDIIAPANADIKKLVDVSLKPEVAAGRYVIDYVLAGNLVKIIAELTTLA